MDFLQLKTRFTAIVTKNDFGNYDDRDKMSFSLIRLICGTANLEKLKNTISPIRGSHPLFYVVKIHNKHSLI